MYLNEKNEDLLRTKLTKAKDILAQIALEDDFYKRVRLIMDLKTELVGAENIIESTKIEGRTG